MSGVSADARKLGQKAGVTWFFGMLSKFSPTLSAGINGIQEVGGALTDKNGRFVRYEIRMNQGPTPPSHGPIPYPNPGYQPFSPTASSSCMKCHSVAKDAQKANADFSFLLNNAK